jgi:tRNA(adenine34) deaminase
MAHITVYYPMLDCSSMINLDQQFMSLALDEARRGMADGEVPVGAVVVLDGEVIARAHNLREGLKDPSAHAEVMALREAARKLDRWRLTGTTLYVTLEPCAMCAGGLVLARITRLVFGAFDSKAGACGSVFDIVRDTRLNHRVEVVSGVLEHASRSLLREFFDIRRTGIEGIENETALERKGL